MEAASKIEKSLFTKVVEVFSTVSAGAFFLSALINTIIFATWGLNFLQIVSVQDVEMSGIFISLLFFYFP